MTSFLSSANDLTSETEEVVKLWCAYFYTRAPDGHIRVDLSWFSWECSVSVSARFVPGEVSRFADRAQVLVCVDSLPTSECGGVIWWWAPTTSLRKLDWMCQKNVSKFSSGYGLSAGVEVGSVVVFYSNTDKRSQSVAVLCLGMLITPH